MKPIVLIRFIETDYINLFHNSKLNTLRTAKSREFSVNTLRRLKSEMGLQGDVETAKRSEEIPFRRSVLRYNSPLVQVTSIGFVCFCCPGMFNALSGMGGGGQVNPTAANNANTDLYTTFAVFGIQGGGICNILGPKLTLVCCCSTYILYAGSFLYYNHYQHQAFAIVAGGVLGLALAFCGRRRVPL